MNKQYFLIISLLVGLGACNPKDKSVEKNDTSLLEYVDPFIGTGAHGHTFPGATAPFGMVQLSPDNGISGWDWCSGYHYSDTTIVGFSHLHLSGTGIGDLCDVLFMPVSKKVDLTTKVEERDDIPYRSKFSHASEIAKPGYYKVLLEDDQITAELSTSQRAGFHKYTYAKNKKQSVVIDLGFAVNWDKPLETSLKMEDEYTVSGYRYSTGWAKDQRVYFVAKFSKPIVELALATDGEYAKGNKELQGVKTSVQLFFSNKDSQELLIKVGVSSVSVNNAKLNIGKENGKFDFEKEKNNSAKSWEKALSKIKVESTDEALKRIFYTALYHSQVAPVMFSDANGEFRRADGEIVKVQDFQVYSTLSLWDTFRAEHPLLTLLEQEKVVDIIKSMLVYYDEKEILPVWTLYGNETNTMTGYHSIPVIVEAYLKGIQNFDVEKAYTAMKKTMMGEDRGLKFYKEYGYIPYDKIDESVTITLEFAYDDWCIAQMAKALGKTEDYEFFNKRSQAYKHLFDKETGFMRGKSDDGKSWHVPFDPKYSAHRINADYTEGNAWQHSWFVLHDVEGLIQEHGGNEKFIKMLEQLFTESSEITGENTSADITGLIGQYAHGNEPSHHIAYMFNYAGVPWRTQYWVREILKTQYSDKPDGLSGNEDCGQMSAWYVLSSMGLYPVNPASAEYQIGSPIFEKVTMQVSNDKTFVIEAKNASDENIYIQSAKLNGKELNRTNISHGEIMQGGTLQLVMGKTPNKNWGIKG